MRYENAYKSVVEFLGSDAGSGFDLTDAQVEELAERLVMRIKPDFVMEPAAVEPHAAALFPKPDEDYVKRTSGRVVPPRQQQPKQTREQQIEAIRDFLNTKWNLVAPGCLLPIPAQSKVNHKLFFDEVNARAARGELIRADYLADIAGGLFQRGLLEKTPVPVEVVPPPPPPSPAEQARELAKKQYAVDRSLNNSETSPIRGAREAAKPLVQPKVALTEEQRQAKEAANRETDAIIAEALSRVNGYMSYSHSKTYSGRSALKAAFERAMDEGLPASDVLRAVEAEASRLTDSGSIR